MGRFTPYKAAPDMIPPAVGWDPQAFQLSTEDRFLTISLAGLARLPNQAQIVAFTDTIRSIASGYTLLLDYSQEHFISSDMVDLCWLLKDVATVITTRENYLRSACINVPGLKIWTVKKQQLPIKYTSINVELFDDFPPEKVWAAASLYTYENGCYSFEQIKRLLLDRERVLSATEHLDISIEQTRFDFIQAVTARYAVNSLMTQFVIDVADEATTIIPYHAHASYEIQADKQILIAKPAVLARRLNAIFRSDLLELEQLLAWPRAEERHFQDYFERHPQVFRSMGYREIYPQLILEREDGTSLRPDFILQPIDSPWCDVLDIKLPSSRLLAGSNDRRRASSNLAEVAAQLREYRAYFEDPKLAKWFESRYGIKCYRPRLKAVIGRGQILQQSFEDRRAMTAYEDLGIITFDQIAEIARQRLLI
ncbi:MAG TPA: Shedu anti-phage system protein SduA domain-containing protein [Tepidisphaeraceae bacterium]|jgi:hypothetical protein